jgi:hypothetical protein
MAKFWQFVLLSLVAVTQALHGKAGPDNEALSQEDAVAYMKQWRPNEDGTMSEGFFRVNAQLALKTQALPYSNQVTKGMFLEYVLPYAHFDEPRDDWRPKMYEVLMPLVKDKNTLQEAAEALFPAWGNAFGKQLQFKSNMTPQCMAPFTETLAKGYASCTGMSIFLADCMRSVGIPARVVGVAEWNRPEGGNHNWVEIWMGDHWNFVDAVPDGNAVTWNKTWFNDQAAKQKSNTHFAIMTPLWGPEAHSEYNISWRTPSTFVPAIDVTADYAVGPISLLTSTSKLVSWSIIPASMVVTLVVAAACGGYAYKIQKERSSGYERLA